jgi:hypothetical protein
MINESALEQMKLSEEIMKQITNCKYCTKISEAPITTPILCIKYAGSTVPISVNLATCLTCGEYLLT